MQLYMMYMAVLLTFLFSCRKNKDVNPPVITLAEPLNNWPVDAGNSIHIKGSVSDDQKLEYVYVKVLSLDGNVQLIEPLSIAIDNNKANIDQYVTVGDLHTTSGTYQVVVEAFDGVNKKKVYRDILVTEIPRELKKIIIVKKAGSGFACDSLVGGSLTTFLTRTSDFSSAAINNYAQFLYLSGRKSGVTEAFDLRTNLPLWSITADVPASGVPLFYFNEFNTHENTFWVSVAASGAGRLKSYGLTGVVSKNIGMQTGHYASAMCSTSNGFIVAEEPLSSGGTTYLSVYFKTGFGLEYTEPSPIADIVKLFELSSNEWLVLGNTSGQGELRIYNTFTHGFWEQVSIPIGKIVDAIQVNSDQYIIAHETGLLKFEHATSNLVNLTTGNISQQLIFDSYSQQLYSCEGNQLKTYHLITGLELSSITVTDSIRTVLIHYNK